MRVAVYGSGAVGGYFGARLAAAGHDVTFIARGDHLEAIRQHGLRVTSINGDLCCRVTATDDPSSIGEVDLVLVGVKAWQVPDVAVLARPLVGSTTSVLPLQNGVETAEELCEVLGHGPVLGGLCRIMSVVDRPGRIVHTAAEPAVIFGELDGSVSDRGRVIREAFTRAGVAAELSTDINTDLWRKFLLVEPWGAVGSASRVPIGSLRTVPESRRVLEQALSEVLELARVSQADLGPDDATTVMARLDSLPKDSLPSMQRDIIAGRPSELEAQVGAVVRRAEPLGVATPVHAAVYGCLLPMERAAREANERR